MTAKVEPWAPNRGIERVNATEFNDIRWVAETGSTNADLMKLASQGRRRPLVLLTDHQNSGRGRQDRTWHDEPGNALLLSALTTADQSWAPLIPLATGLAAVTSIEQFVAADGEWAAPDGQSPVGLKWPNDVLVPGSGEQKLAGILVEARPSRPTRSCGAAGKKIPTLKSGDAKAGELVVVIGMGLNLHWSVEPPAAVRGRGATLTELWARTRSDDFPVSARDDLLINYLVALDQMLGRLRAGASGRQQTLADYRQRCLSLGRSLSFTSSGGTVTGTAVEIGPGGELLIESEEGTIHRLVAGDAHHQRGTALPG